MGNEKLSNKQEAIFSLYSTRQCRGEGKLLVVPKFCTSKSNNLLTVLLLKHLMQDFDQLLCTGFLCP